MPYKLKYYRDPESSRRYKEYGGLDKPSGLYLSPHKYGRKDAAERDARHINSLGPIVPVIVVGVSG